MGEIRKELPNDNEDIVNSHEKTKKIIRIFPTPKFVIDKNHDVIYRNRALEEYAHIPTNKIIGTKMHWKVF